MTELAASKSKQQTLNEILQQVCREGQITAAIVANLEGFPIAAASLAQDAETMAAMVAYLRDTARRAQTQLGLAQLDEVTIRDRDQSLLVCRSFAVNDGDELLLVVMVPRRRAYRRLTNIAIQRIRNIWQAKS
jgi:predicted regulator of Ras-like GTPase activity (Roadblock/LC7/MglB family)